MTLPFDVYRSLEFLSVPRLCYLASRLWQGGEDMESCRDSLRREFGITSLEDLGNLATALEQSLRQFTETNLQRKFLLKNTSDKSVLLNFAAFMFPAPNLASFDFPVSRIGGASRDIAPGGEPSLSAQQVEPTLVGSFGSGGDFYYILLPSTEREVTVSVLSEILDIKGIAFSYVGGQSLGGASACYSLSFAIKQGWVTIEPVLST